jgi:hypothetical protein
MRRTPHDASFDTVTACYLSNMVCLAFPPLCNDPTGCPGPVFLQDLFLLSVIPLTRRHHESITDIQTITRAVFWQVI